MAIDLERLKPKAQVRLPGGAEIVTLVAVAPGPFWEFFFDGPSGPGKQVLAESEVTAIELVDRPEELRFDGDPVQFRLGVEARRIDIAFAYEMAAVAVSNFDPLPHQLEPGFWAAARALGEVLPYGDRERTMLLGLSGNRDALVEAAAKSSSSIETLTLFDGGA